MCWVRRNRGGLQSTGCWDNRQMTWAVVVLRVRASLAMEKSPPGAAWWSWVMVMRSRSGPGSARRRKGWV
ncbi:hypothetical protein BJP39_10265 [Streptomyces sp. CC77]|nr:hypothetical protein BJP39_10265 [Streptomyces sp. CC77]